MRLPLTSMRYLKYPLLFAWTAVAAWLPAGGKRTADGRVPLQLKSYGDKASWWELNGALHKRADEPVDYCRYWGQSSALVGDRLYSAGGIGTYKENLRSNTIYIFPSVLVADLSGNVQFPVRQDDSRISLIPMDDSGDGTQQGAFWWDGGDYIYKYGGWFADSRTWNNTPQALVKPSDIWRFGLKSLTWENESISPRTLRRAWGGAVASVPEKKIGYFLGGIVENRTDTVFADAPGYLVLQDNFLNFDSGSNVFVNKTAPELGHIALGNLVHIPDLGNDGILVYLGGAEGPSRWVPTDTTDGMTLRDLGTAWVYDISNSRWYSQKTSGATPKGRISACAVVIPSQDNSSWNIFMHGGGSLGSNTGSVYGDTWVLSLPSFQWAVVDEDGDEKFEHTCHVIKGNKMLVVGGRDKLQDFSGNPARNYTVDSTRWSCLRQGIFSSMNLNTFEWENSIPVNTATYEVNSKITALIGGSATGGADKLAPLNGWDDSGLGSVMFIKSVEPPTSSKSSTPLGAIIGGVVGGIVLIALIIGGFIFVRKRKSKDPATTDPAPPVAQPPGYTWDAQTQQYYPLVEVPTKIAPAELAVHTPELPAHVPDLSHTPDSSVHTPELPADSPVHT